MSGWQGPARRLDAAPLVAAIQTRCHYRQQSPWRLFDKDTVLAHTYDRALREGTVTLHAVEQLCDALGWHPRELYGDTYDDVIFKRSERTPPGGHERPDAHARRAPGGQTLAGPGEGLPPPPPRRSTLDPGPAPPQSEPTRSGAHQ